MLFGNQLGGGILKIDCFNNATFSRFRTGIQYSIDFDYRQPDEDLVRLHFTNKQTTTTPWEQQQ